MNKHPYESAQDRDKWVQILFVAFIVLTLLMTALALVENSILSGTVNEVELDDWYGGLTGAYRDSFKYFLDCLVLYVDPSDSP